MCYCSRNKYSLYDASFSRDPSLYFHCHNTSRSPPHDTRPISVPPPIRTGSSFLSISLAPAKDSRFMMLLSMITTGRTTTTVSIGDHRGFIPISLAPARDSRFMTLPSMITTNRTSMVHHPCIGQTTSPERYSPDHGCLQFLLGSVFRVNTEGLSFGMHFVIVLRGYLSIVEPTRDYTPT
ncbi:hypothetical protein JAAARDRAFT_404215 [Jaapia argillacea MUCL 33604]|uniref:Uncharacterized protein n=1 Tax=Jaapia argillacea MUCL 33604 TaxID=933084 RepID=A0A067PKA7_9AGAM|nr:hypothetical protein JAAARDRAFT_404215 [Jaapia argillacea MUCL 33604]